MHSQTDTTIDEFDWRGELWCLSLTVYFHVSDFHPATRWQDSYGGEVAITGLSVDSARCCDANGNDRWASQTERYEIGRAVLNERTDWLVDECYASV